MIWLKNWGDGDLSRPWKPLTSHRMLGLEPGSLAWHTRVFGLSIRHLHLLHSPTFHPSKFPLFSLFFHSVPLVSQPSNSPLSITFSSSSIVASTILYSAFSTPVSSDHRNLDSLAGPRLSLFPRPPPSLFDSSEKGPRTKQSHFHLRPTSTSTSLLLILVFLQRT